MDHPINRLTPLRQECVGLISENGDVANIAQEPQFWGFCCGPAKSCCCGYSLQSALRAFAIIAGVLGLSGLWMSINYLGLDATLLATESFIYSGLLFALGISLRRTASSTSPNWGDVHSYFLAGVCVMNIIETILMMNPSAQYMDKVKELISIMHPELSPEASERTLLEVIAQLKKFTIFKCIFYGFLYLLILYYIWSFIVRAKRGEYLLPASHDPPTFVQHPVAPQPNSQTQLNQLQPSTPSQPQHFYRVEGNQVQQSAMQAAPHSQPPPQ